MNAALTAGRPAYGGRAKSVLVAAGTVLCAVLLALLGPLGSGKAHALDEDDAVYWNLSAGKAGYRAMIDEIRERVEQTPLYGINPTSVYTTNRDTSDYFGLNIVSDNHIKIKLVIRAHDLYVQGYYVPSTSRYYHFSDAAFRDYPSTSSHPVQSLSLPFHSGYEGMTGYMGQGKTMKTPTFSNNWFRYNTQTMMRTNATGAERAGGLLSFVEAVCEGARFDKISGQIYNHMADASGYKFDDADCGAVKNWQAIGDNFQKRLDNPSTKPYQTIRDSHTGNTYDFSTLDSTSRILALVLLWLHS